MSTDIKELALLRAFFRVDMECLRLRNTPRAERDFDWQVALGKANHERSELRHAIAAMKETK